MVSRRPPQATTSRAISASPRVISAATELLSESQPIANSSGDGDNVLQSAAEFHADDIVVGIDAKAESLNACWTAPRYVAVSMEVTVTAVGSPRATSLANDGPLEGRHASGEFAVAQDVR